MKIVIHPKYSAYQDFVHALPTTFETSGEPVFKKRNVVKRFLPSGFIVKRYKRPHLVQRLAYTFWRKSKAERAYLFAEKLQALGICTPQGIAYIEVYRHGLLNDAYFVSTACDDPSLLLLRDEAHYDTSLADALAAYLVELHEKGILHGDLNLSNILYRKEGDTVRFTLIDTNRSSFKVSLTREECLKNLMRLTHRRDLLRYVVERYACLRGWDSETSVARVLHLLDRFEHRNDLKRKWKKRH